MIWSRGGLADGNWLQMSKNEKLDSETFFQSSPPCDRERRLFCSSALVANRAKSAQKDFVGLPNTSSISVKTCRTVTRLENACRCLSETLSDTQAAVIATSPSKSNHSKALLTSSGKFS